MKKIMVVDNDRIILRFMTKLLEKEGYQVVTAADGLNALDILKTYTPDVIFVDLVMPNIDGEILCRIIRSIQKLQDVCLIILSAIAAEERINIAQLGANACIAKGPFNEMAQHIKAVLEQPDLTSLQFLTEEVIGAENIHARGITAELLSTKKHFKTILDKMSEGILEINSEGRIVYANQFAISLIDMPEKKLMGSHFIDMFSGDDRLRVNSLLKTRGAKPKTITEDSHVTLNDYQVTLNILPLEKDVFTSVIILKDISERIRIESQLRQSQKMEAIGTLAGGIAHDFNNLLMGIQGRASLMLIDKDSSCPDFEHLKGIEGYVKSAADLTNQLLAFARGGKYEVRATDLNQLVKNQNRMFARTKKEITIGEKYEENLWAAEVDQGQIEQVLLNLYVNAWHSMPGGGNLYIQTENVTIDENYTKLFAVTPGRYVKISVIDTGVGMDQATRQRIFEPFFTTREMGRGTGLGLASVYGIVKNHGGFINVYSEKGEGSTFNIFLPASEKEVIEEKELTKDIFISTETVLLVDDEDMIIDVGQPMLEEMGYKVLIAKSGSESIDVYQTNKDKIDLVILDMVMPVMGGGETYDKLKEMDPDIKVLLSSGYSIDGQATEILNRGCDGFIQKPFSMKELSQKIREILDN